MKFLSAYLSLLCIMHMFQKMSEGRQPQLTQTYFLVMLLSSAFPLILKIMTDRLTYRPAKYPSNQQTDRKVHRFTPNITQILGFQHFFPFPTSIALSLSLFLSLLGLFIICMQHCLNLHVLLNLFILKCKFSSFRYPKLVGQTRSSEKKPKVEYSGSKNVIIRKKLIKNSLRKK